VGAEDAVRDFSCRGILEAAFEEVGRQTCHKLKSAGKTGGQFPQYDFLAAADDLDLPGAKL
jgi:hypothetical protein